MSNELLFPKTLQEAIVYFSDADRCHTYSVQLRWPAGITCPRCEHKEHSFLSTRKIWFCKGCKKQFSVKVGTIFEDSPLGMDKWMMAVWMVTSCKNGISSYEMARDLGITQKSAWFLDHRVRRALHEGSFDKPLSGHVEVAETFIGGKARNMHVEKRARRITGTGRKDNGGYGQVWNAAAKSVPRSFTTERPFNLKSRNTLKPVPRFTVTHYSRMRDWRANTPIS